MPFRSIARLTRLLATILFCALAATASADAPPRVLCAAEGSFDFDALNLLSGTGTASLDRALTQELQAQSRFFGVRPAFYIYRSADRNAMATLHTFARTAQTDGTVLYEVSLLREHLTSAHWGGSIVAGVIAHEFAHIVQFSDPALFDQLSGRHNTVKFLELHADFMAGFYMGTKFAASPDDIETLARKIFALGDTHFTNAGHHGTPQERHVALRAGFRHYVTTPGADITGAVAEGAAFVTAVFPDFHKE